MPSLCLWLFDYHYCISAHVYIGEFLPLGDDKVLDAVNGSVQQTSTYQQDEKNHVRERRREIHHLCKEIMFSNSSYVIIIMLAILGRNKQVLNSSKTLIVLHDQMIYYDGLSA